MFDDYDGETIVFSAGAEDVEISEELLDKVIAHDADAVIQIGVPVVAGDAEDAEVGDKGRFHVKVKLTTDALKYIKGRGEGQRMSIRRYTDWKDRTFMKKWEDGMMVVDVDWEHVQDHDFGEVSVSE